MQTKFSKLFQVQLTHEYYRDGVCKQMLLYPDESTTNWFKQYGVLFKQFNNVGFVMAPDTFDLHEIIGQNPDLQFIFNCSIQNSEFVNFTDYPLNELGRIIFSNKESEMNDQGAFVMKGTFEPLSNGNANQVAVIQIQLDQVETDSAKWPIIYQGHFKSRATPWKYFIIGQTGENTKIKLSGKGAELFGDVQVDQLFDGTEAQTFSSNSNHIPFKENGAIDLSLLSKSTETTGVDKILIKHLPNASPDSLTSLSVDGKQEIISAIYIYL